MPEYVLIRIHTHSAPLTTRAHSGMQHIIMQDNFLYVDKDIMVRRLVVTHVECGAFLITCKSGNENAMCGVEGFAQRYFAPGLRRHGKEESIHYRACARMLW